MSYDRVCCECKTIVPRPTMHIGRLGVLVCTACAASDRVGYYELRAENARLREALTTVADHFRLAYPNGSQVETMVRDALEGTGT